VTRTVATTLGVADRLAPAPPVGTWLPAMAAVAPPPVQQVVDVDALVAVVVDAVGGAL